MYTVGGIKRVSAMSVFRKYKTCISQIGGNKIERRKNYYAK